MTINAQGKAQNVKASLEHYIHEKLVVTEGLVVDFQGKPFESADQQEWVQERIMGFPNHDYHRQTTSALEGQTTTVLLNFNIFVNKESPTNRRTNRSYEIRDIVADYFKIGTEIDLYDASNSDWTTSLQKMFVFDVATDAPISDETFEQYSYAVEILWLEQF